MSGEEAAPHSPALSNPLTAMRSGMLEVSFSYRRSENRNQAKRKLETMAIKKKRSIEDLGLDEDMLYPLPSGTASLTHKLPKDMNRQERRALLAAVERCDRLGLAHPYVGRIND